MPNPRASAALLRMASEMGGVTFPLLDLEAESRVVAERVDQFLAERPSCAKPSNACPSPPSQRRSTRA